MLYKYIEDNFTPERAKQLLLSIELLGKFNVNEVEEQMEEYAFHIENLDTVGRVGGINNVIKVELFNVLNLHGILLNDSSDNLKVLYDMTDTLKLVSEEYDPSYVLANMNFELDDTNEAVDVFAELVNLLTDSSVDSVLDETFSVDDDIIKNIVINLEDRRVSVPDFEDTSEYVERYKEFLKGKRYGLVYELIRANVEVGSMEFNSLFVLVEDGLYKLHRDDLIFELISLILISNVETTELSETFNRVGRLVGQTEAEGKLFTSDLRKTYTETVGRSL
ncbi:hypothetical protein TSMG0032 [Halocynthia phage JM-2012]|uniref:hypothetical protein n=1 Tax=Halocynthia phage JM-2012 TaxID=1173297 RepID=UPI00025C68EF|nr:hypothetical protein TSMG0032 [Halocynthia phage JM-2012]AFI55315.1 hypothetical protein TSMG0032 [Halocynthia phage JM-2012]